MVRPRRVLSLSRLPNSLRNYSRPRWSCPRATGLIKMAPNSPSRARWIVRYPNGMYGASLREGLDDQLPGPGPAEDRPREPPPSDPDRPAGAHGAGHYTSYTENTNITTAMQGLNYLFLS